MYCLQLISVSRWLLFHIAYWTELSFLCSWIPLNQVFSQILYAFMFLHNITYCPSMQLCYFIYPLPSTEFFMVLVRFLHSSLSLIEFSMLFWFAHYYQSSTLYRWFPTYIVLFKVLYVMSSCPILPISFNTVLYNVSSLITVPNTLNHILYAISSHLTLHTGSGVRLPLTFNQVLYAIVYRFILPIILNRVLCVVSSRLLLPLAFNRVLYVGFLFHINNCS